MEVIDCASYANFLINELLLIDTKAISNKTIYGITTTYYGLGRGRVVSASDLQSGGFGFEFPTVTGWIC